MTTEPPSTPDENPLRPREKRLTCVCLSAGALGSTGFAILMHSPALMLISILSLLMLYTVLEAMSIQNEAAEAAEAVSAAQARTALPPEAHAPQQEVRPKPGRRSAPAPFRMRSTPPQENARARREEIIQDVILAIQRHDRGLLAIYVVVAATIVFVGTTSGNPDAFSLLGALPVLSLFEIRQNLRLISTQRNNARATSHPQAGQQQKPAPPPALPDQAAQSIETLRAELEQTILQAGAAGDLQTKVRAQGILDQELPQTVEMWARLPRTLQHPQDLEEALSAIRLAGINTSLQEQQWKSHLAYLRRLGTEESTSSLEGRRPD